MSNTNGTTAPETLNLAFPVTLPGLRIRATDLTRILDRGMVASSLGSRDGAELLLAWIHSLKVDLDRLDRALDGEIGPLIDGQGQIRWLTRSREALAGLRQTVAFQGFPDDVLCADDLTPPAVVTDG